MVFLHYPTNTPAADGGIFRTLKRESSGNDMWLSKPHTHKQHSDRYIKTTTRLLPQPTHSLNQPDPLHLLVDHTYIITIKTHYTALYY